MVKAKKYRSNKAKSKKTRTTCRREKENEEEHVEHTTEPNCKRSSSESFSLTEGVAFTCSFILCSWTWWTSSSSLDIWSLVSSISLWYWLILSLCLSIMLFKSPLSFKKGSFRLSSFSSLPIFWLCLEIVVRKLAFSCSISVLLSCVATPSSWSNLQDQK